MKVLILGGYGVFGGRLVRLLADIEGLEVLVAGRSEGAARAFCDRTPATARLRPCGLDRRDIAAALARERPGLVVDASGPFQAYGDDPYLVPEAAIRAGADYLDLADGAEFVAGIGALDADARAAGRFVLAGVSSFPVLTAAVLAEMSRQIEVTQLRAGIAPSPFAGVGRNVLNAVLGYAGSPVRVLTGGRWSEKRALVSSWRAVVAPPGCLPLRRLRFSLVDVPDLTALPAAYPGLRDLWVGAAPQPAFWHGLLSCLAALRAALRLPPLTRLAPLAQVVLNHLTWGDHRGGMVIAAEAAGDGPPQALSWHLLAEADAGPLIPSMAAEGVIRGLLDGRRPAPGARSGIGALSLGDYETLFAAHAIHTGWRRAPEGALYPRLLGPAFGKLAAPLCKLHRPGPRAVWSGRAEVTRGKGRLAAAVAALFGFPRAGRDIPVTVTFTTDAQGRETWERRFGDTLMRSTQEAGQGASEGLMVERFGPFAFALALVVDGDRLRIVNRGWRLFGVPLPFRLMPGGAAWEQADGARFRFHVEITLPVLGPVVRYDGWLLPAP